MKCGSLGNQGSEVRLFEFIPEARVRRLMVQG